MKYLIHAVKNLIKSAVNPEMLSFYIDYLKKEKSKGVKPSSFFAGSLLYRLGDEFREKNGISWTDYKRDYFNDEPVTFKKAFETVFGKDGWNAMKDANKKIR